MSARAPFRPGGAGGAQVQERTQPAAAAQPVQDQHIRTDDPSLFTPLLPKSNGVAEQPSRPFNPSSLKKLTNKKSSNRGECVPGSLKDSLSEPAIHSPRPRAASTLFGQPIHAVHPPHPPPSRASTTAVTNFESLPPDTIPVRPPSRGTLSSYDQASPFPRNNSPTPRPDAFSPSLPHSVSPDVSEIPFIPVANQRADPPDPYSDHNRRRNLSNDSPYRGPSHNPRNSGNFYEHGIKRGPQDTDSSHSSKRVRVETETQYHRRETSPFSDIADMHVGDANDRHTGRRRRQPVTNQLQVLLGNFDLDAFVGTRAQQYEAEIAKWQSCSRADWEAHATVLSDKFSALLDMVKDHMGRKIQLYTSLQGITEKQHVILEERDRALDDIRQELLDQARGVGGR